MIKSNLFKRDVKITAKKSRLKAKLFLNLRDLCGDWDTKAKSRVPLIPKSRSKIPLNRVLTVSAGGNAAQGSAPVLAGHASKLRTHLIAAYQEAMSCGPVIFIPMTTHAGNLSPPITRGDSSWFHVR
jgi:hypothetical protein